MYHLDALRKVAQSFLFPFLSIEYFQAPAVIGQVESEDLFWSTRVDLPTFGQCSFTHTKECEPYEQGEPVLPADPVSFCQPLLRPLRPTQTQDEFFICQNYSIISNNSLKCLISNVIGRPAGLGSGVGLYQQVSIP